MPFNAPGAVIERAYPVVLRATGAPPAARHRCSPIGLFCRSWQRIPHLGVELLPEIHQGEFHGLRQACGSAARSRSPTACSRRLDERVRRSRRGLDRR
jgi:hypothetical protein